MNSTAALFLVLFVCTVLYHILAAVCAVIFYLRQKPDLTLSHWPKAACLKPLCGADSCLSSNLKSFLCQDYPDYQVIFGTAHREDPAYSIADSVCGENAHCHARAVTGEQGNGTNRKIRNLLNIESHVDADAQVLVISDSDIRVDRKYLKQAVAPVCSSPDVGASTALYRIENVFCPGDVLEALSVETTFVPGVLVAATFSKLTFAFGATIVLRRSDFIKAGGFRAVENHLADDYRIGNNMSATGRHVALAPCVVAVSAPHQSLKKTLAHLTRWNRTIRICRPAGYFFSIICCCSLWTLLAAAAAGTAPLAWAIVVGGCSIRIITAAVAAACIGSKKGIIRAVLTPLWDLAAAVIWLCGLVGTTVTWRGVRYRLFSDGRMKEIT